jgi:hypothetical protein
LENKRCLLVLDDVTHQIQIEPFLRLGEHCTLIITTRQLDLVLQPEVVLVASMSAEEVEQFSQHCPAGSRSSFLRVAKELQNMPLALNLAAQALLDRVQRGDEAVKAGQWLEQSISRRGLRFDRQLTTILDSAIEALNSDDRARVLSLASLDKDEVALEEAAKLWRVDMFDTEEIAERLERTALVQLDLKSQGIRVHGLLRRYCKETAIDGSSVPGTMKKRRPLSHRTIKSE